MKPLTKKEILKRHKKNPKDKSLHKIIEAGEIKKEEFNKHCLILRIKQSLILTSFELN